MKKYRIVTDGHRYKVQTRVWFLLWFFWEDISYRSDRGLRARRVTSFKTLEEAQEALEYTKARDAAKEARMKSKWETVK